jgi:ZIP family zinc transporter
MIGAAIILLVKKPGKIFLGATLGFASGVMLVVAFLNLTQKSIEMAGYSTAVTGFMIGAIFILIIDKSLPHVFTFKERGVLPGLYKMGALMAIGIAIHNIPEGIAVSTGYVHLPTLGVIIAISIALHNVPEGIVTGVPLYKAGMSKKRVLSISLLSGLAEPLGALIGVATLSIVPSLVPWGLAFAGGVMAFLTIDELVPTSHYYGHENAISASLIVGLFFAMLLPLIFGS